MNLFDKIMMAFKVMARWEILVSLAAFVALWLLVRYIADPWSRSARPRPAPRRSRAAKVPAPEPVQAEEAKDIDSPD